MEQDERPPRRAIPVRIKRQVCERQGFVCRRCGVSPVSWLPRSQTHFDHEPALRLRTVNDDRTDYIPAQHSPDHIDALCIDCHKVKTKGAGATTAGTDVGKIKKERKRNRAKKPSRAWASRPMRSANRFPPKGSIKFRKR